jgi:hypothetical protein
MGHCQSETFGFIWLKRLVQLGHEIHGPALFDKKGQWQLQISELAEAYRLRPSSGLPGD